MGSEHMPIPIVILRQKYSMLGVKQDCKQNNRAAVYQGHSHSEALCNIDAECAAPLWTKVDSTVYSLTYIMGFVVTGAFVLLFLLLIVFQSAVREHHSRGRTPLAGGLIILSSQKLLPPPKQTILKMGSRLAEIPFLYNHFSTNN